MVVSDRKACNLFPAVPAFDEIWLMDNGSLRPDATLWLRCLAEALGDRLGEPVRPVSLLHASGVDPSELEGVSAEIFEPAVRKRLAAGRSRIGVVPLFFGPSGAITDYLPKRIRRLQKDFPDLAVTIAPTLAGGDGDDILTEILRTHVLTTLTKHDLDVPHVILVDHGSPAQAVTEVRNRLAARLADELQGTVSAVRAASMERREGEEYAFNEPLLARALRELPYDGRAVVVAMLFLLPGRHAGDGGDIATICEEAQAERPRKIVRTPLVAEDPRLLDILESRAALLLGKPAATAQCDEG